LEKKKESNFGKKKEKKRGKVGTKKKGKKKKHCGLLL